MPEDILCLKHDYESVMVIDRVSKIPLALGVGSSYLLSVLELLDLFCAV